MKKLGAHLIGEPDINLVARYMNNPVWQGPVKSLGRVEYLLALADALPYKPILIQRWYWHNWGSADSFDVLKERGVEKAYDIWVNECVDKHQFELLAQSPHRNRVYLEGHCEVGLDASPAGYLEFETYRARRLWQDYGLHSMLLNSGVGWDWPIEALQKTGVLQAARETGSMLGCHAYFGAIANMWSGDCQAISPTDRLLQHGDLVYHHTHRKSYKDGLDHYLALRPLRYHALLEQAGYGDIQIFATETGIDNVAGESIKLYTQGHMGRGWQNWEEAWRAAGLVAGNVTPEDFYAGELAYLEQNYAAWDDWFAGGTLFTCFGDWENFNHYPKALDALLALWEQTPSPEDAETEEDDMPEKEYVLTITVAGLENLIPIVVSRSQFVAITANLCNGVPFAEKKPLVVMSSGMSGNTTFVINLAQVAMISWEEQG